MIRTAELLEISNDAKEMLTSLAPITENVVLAVNTPLMDTMDALRSTRELPMAFSPSTTTLVLHDDPNDTSSVPPGVGSWVPSVALNVTLVTVGDFVTQH